MPIAAPTAEQIQGVTTFIQQRSIEDRDRLFAIDGASDDDAEPARRIEAALHIATTHLCGFALYQATPPNSNSPILAVYWEALTRTASQWAEHPDWPDYLPKPEWAL